MTLTGTAVASNRLLLWTRSRANDVVQNRAWVG
jgi:hypothetical protein